MNPADSESGSYSPAKIVNGNKGDDTDSPWKEHGDSAFENTPEKSDGDSPAPPLCYRRQGASFKALKTAVKNLASLDDFVCEKLGSGFFSDVYKVTHRQTNQIMVLKMNTLSSNRRNVLGEVQLLNRLSHPNILRFMGVCVHEGKLNALTEFCNGGNLESLLASDAKLDWDLRVQLSLDIAEGMKYLHSKGVIHRDLTSMNCLIKNEDNKRCVAVVADFGLACKIPKEGQHRLSVVGSPYWMAPECLNGLPYNERVDLFSFGIILCEIIARIPADPDYLPRLENFGLDIDTFMTMCGDCPDDFLQLAFQFCNRDPNERPPFAESVDLLHNILVMQQLREDLMDVVMADREKEACKPTAFKGHKRAKSASGTPSPPLSPIEPRSPFSLIRSNSDRHGFAGHRMITSSPPSRVNPFDTPQLKGGRTKLVSQGEVDGSTAITIASPATPPSSPVFPEEIMTNLEELYRHGRRKSQSLPASPVLLRRRLSSPSTGDSLSVLSTSGYFSAGKSKQNRSFGSKDSTLSPTDLMKTSTPSSDPGNNNTSKLGQEFQLPLQSKGRRLDSGLSSLCDEELERISEISTANIPRGGGRRRDATGSPDPLQSSGGSTCSSIPSTTRLSLDFSNWDDAEKH